MMDTTEDLFGASPGLPQEAAEAETAPPARKPSDAPADKPTITKAGLEMIAAAKTGAIGRALADPEIGATDLLRLLLLALSGANVTVIGEGHYGGVKFHDLAERLVDDNGRVRAGQQDVGPLARVAISRITRVGAPHERWQAFSGDVAETIGRAINAYLDLPRFDTREFLSTLSGQRLDVLLKYAGKRRDAIVKAGKQDCMAPRDAIIQALIGALPDWRPDEARFIRRKPQAARHE